MRALPLVLVAAGSIAAASAQAAPENRIGTTASAKNDVTGLRGAAQRSLKLGDGVFQNESIATGNAASAQILFTDETALTMGPNSRVVLDKLIYDPGKKSGEMTIRTVTGVFRFVTGSGPKDGYKVQTPVGTIGVRGTIFHVWIKDVGPTTQVTVQVDEGGAFIQTATKRVELPAGSYVIIKAGTAPGSSQVKYGKECGSGGPHCYVNDGSDTLLIDFLGRRIFNDLTPAAGPTAPPPNNPPPGNGPPPPGSPPPVTGHAPILTGSGQVPPGIQNQPTLPPGLANRGPTFLPPGLQKK